MENPYIKKKNEYIKKNMNIFLKLNFVKKK